MSATTNTLSNSVVVDTEVKTKAPRVKKPALSGKYSKFLIFGYGLVQSLQARGVLTDEGVESAYNELKLLSSVDDQTQFYEGVLNQSNETGKLMRKYVTQRLAPPKAPRAKKESVAKPPRTKKDASEKNQEKKSVSRTKKATRVESDVSNDIVAELVDAANADPVVNNAATTAADKDAQKKAKEEAKKAKEEAKKAKEEAKEEAKKAKEEAKKAKEEAKEEAKKAKEAAKEAKEAAKKANPQTSDKKSKAIEAPVATAAADEDEDEEIHTQEIDINGKTYLIDNENNLYSCVTHEELGKYDSATKSVIASE